MRVAVAGGVGGVDGVDGGVGVERWVMLDRRRPLVVLKDRKWKSTADRVGTRRLGLDMANRNYTGRGKRWLGWCDMLRRLLRAGRQREKW